MDFNLDTLIFSKDLQMVPHLIQYGKLSRLSSICFFVVVLGNFVNGQATRECSETKLQECTNVLNQKHELRGVGPVFTQDEIHKICGPLLEAEDCVMQQYSNCPEFQSRPRPQSSTESLQQIQKCRVLVERYVHKLGCYMRLDDTYQKCLDKERGMFQKSIDNIHGGNRELQQEGCCNVRRIFDCILIPTGEQCDKDSMSIMEEFLHLSFPSSVSSVCPQYKCLENSQSTDRKPGPEDDHDNHIHSRSGSPSDYQFPIFSTILFISLLLNYSLL